MYKILHTDKETIKYFLQQGNNDNTVEFVERRVSILTYYFKFKKEYKKHWN